MPPASLAPFAFRRSRSMPSALFARVLACGLSVLAPSCASVPEFEDLELPAGVPQGRIPLEAFFADGPLERPRLSPDGRYVAGFQRVNGKRNIVKIDLDTGETTPVTAFDGTTINDFWWAADDRILFSVALQGGRVRRLASVGADGQGLVDFSDRRDPKGRIPDAATQQFGDRIVSLLPDDPAHILVAYSYFPTPNRLATDLHRLNVNTGRSILTVRSNDHPFNWIVDPRGQVRVGIGVDDGRAFVVHRADEDGPFRQIDAARQSLDEISFVVLGLSEDPSQLYVLSRHEHDRFALYLYDTESETFSSAIFSHPRVDVTGPLVYTEPAPGETARVIGVEYIDHHRRVHWLDPDWQALMQKVDAALPDTVNRIVSSSRGGRRLLVYATSDRHPGRHHLVEPDVGRVLGLAPRRPDLDPERMARVEPVTYAARDGLEISGYVALPPGSAEGPVPFVVSPHGGPDRRNSRDFDDELQFFTSRGWGVFQPNFRGSGGFGLAHEAKGYRAWGLGMQDDITDGVRWLIESGRADPERICIYGGGYGGYAAVMALRETPELYACGASLAGVFDLDALLADRAFYANPEVIEQRIGNRRADRERLRATSPVEDVAPIRAPVFLAHGVEDPIVRVDQSERMARALAESGKAHDLLLLADQPHGLIDEPARLRFYRNLEAFLYRHLGPGPTRSPEAR